MNYQIEKFNDHSGLFLRYNLETKSNLLFIPENFLDTQESSKFIYSETTTEIRKVFKRENCSINYLTDDKPLLRTRKSADWFGPTIFIGYSIVSFNPTLVDISISLLSSYLYDLFKGKAENKKVQFDIIVETTTKKDYKKITYSGNTEGIKELSELIKELRK